MVLININEHLSKNKIIVKQQSGFRAHRQTKDNLFYLCQKNIEAFNRKMKNCVIFFDISKAFDKVWHNGLLFKLISHKFDKYIISWINELLNGRNFQIKINNTLSDEYQIEVGVPQGGVLSPILFSVYINDIIFDKIIFNKSATESTLFADDLATSCTAKNIKTLEKIFKLYMEKLENWLIKWRLCINPNKCQLILFSKCKQEAVNIELFNEIIPQSDNIKFLGLYLDRSMNLTKCVEDLHAKCHKRLNIIKILSHKSWNLTSETIRNVYFSLIRSILDYAAIIYDLLCETKKQDFRSIQYHALRAAYRKPLKFSHKELLIISKSDSIDERVKRLNEKYFQNCFLYKNEMVLEAINKYFNWYSDNKDSKFKTILCNYRDKIKTFR